MTIYSMEDAGDLATAQGSPDWKNPTFASDADRLVEELAAMGLTEVKRVSDLTTDGGGGYYAAVIIWGDGREDAWGDASAAAAVAIMNAGLDAEMVIPEYSPDSRPVNTRVRFYTKARLARVQAARSVNREVHAVGSTGGDWFAERD